MTLCWTTFHLSLFILYFQAHQCQSDITIYQFTVTSFLQVWGWHNKLTAHHNPYDDLTYPARQQRRCTAEYGILSLVIFSWLYFSAE